MKIFVGIFLLLLTIEIYQTVRFFLKGAKFKDLTYWWWAIGCTLFMLIILFNFR